uniref:RING-type domain-containing protein n=1 Tax=Panagrolaimus sp. ES5 TaxID=591445 RepID=A0AC34FQN4_9BILA
MSNETTASLKTYNLLSQTRTDHAGLPMNGNITDCFICCQPSDVFAVGKCIHPICMECSIVMRILDKSNTCPQCRDPIEMLYFVSAPYSWDNFTFPAGEVRHRDSQKYGIKFTSDYTVKCYDSYLQHSCSICAKINSKKVFPTFSALKHHMKIVHQRNFCSICDQHLQSLSKNRVAFTDTEMENHLKGTNNEASGQKGHPLCWCCGQRFYDDDFLNRHLKSEHFFCQLCEDLGSIVSFSTTPELYEHYAMEHFACDSRDCQHMGICFSTEEELELHKADEHGFSLRNLTALFTGRSNQNTPQREGQPLASEPASSAARNASIQTSSAARNASIQSIRTSLLNIARTRPSTSSQVSNNASIRTAVLNDSRREAESPSSSSSRPSPVVRNVPSNQSVQTAILNGSQREAQPRPSPIVRNAPSNRSVQTAILNGSQREAQPRPTAIVRNAPSNQSVQTAIVNTPSSSSRLPTVRNAPSSQSVRTAILNVIHRETPSSILKTPPSILSNPRTRPSASSQVSNNSSVQTSILNGSQRSSSSTRLPPIVRNVPSNQSFQTAVSNNSQRSSASRTSTPRIHASEISAPSSRSSTTVPARNIRTPPPPQSVRASPPLSTSSNDSLMPTTNISPLQRQRRHIFLSCISAIFLVIVFLFIIKMMTKKN